MAKKKLETKHNDILNKYNPMLKKIGEEAAKLAKKSEEGVKSISQMAKIQMDILASQIQKEKIYYDIGKEVAEKIMGKGLDVASLDKYKKRLSALEKQAEKKKKEIGKIKKSMPKQ